MSGKVNPVPEGYHTVTPYLVVNDGAAAIEFYKKAFGAEVAFCMPGPSGQGVAHAEIKIGNSMVMMGEEWPGSGISAPGPLKGTTVAIHLYVEDVDASFKRAIDAGATSLGPVMDMFWGDRMGKATDPFGHVWSLGSHIEDVSPEEMAQRAKKAMGGGCGEGCGCQS